MWKTAISALALCAASSAALADWQLDNDLSKVSFVSVKKDSVGEAHQFNKLSGSLTASGQLQLAIDLASVDTGIAIRDQRMAEYLFETAKFAQVTLHADVAEPLKALLANQPKLLSATAKLSLHGVNKEIQVEVLALKTGSGDLLVSSVKPVIINPADFGLNAGIDKLQQLAGLPSITRSVPVSFVLNLQKQ